MRRGLERRELSLELGDARGQRVALGLERLAVARAQRSEGGRRILLDNSRVYVRVLPFVSGRVHPGRLGDYELF